MKVLGPLLLGVSIGYLLFRGGNAVVLSVEVAAFTTVMYAGAFMGMMTAPDGPRRFGDAVGVSVVGLLAIVSTLLIPQWSTSKDVAGTMKTMLVISQMLVPWLGAFMVGIGGGRFVGNR